VRLALTRDERALVIRVDAPWHGDPPPPGPPGPCDRLWEHEVVELFLVGPLADGPEYLEIELSPHGHHLVLRLHGVRRVVERGLPLELMIERVAAGRWEARAAVPSAWLPHPVERLAAFAIHGSGPARRYLASTPLPGATPDFHQPARFPRLSPAAAKLFD